MVSDIDQVKPLPRPTGSGRPGWVGFSAGRVFAATVVLPVGFEEEEDLGMCILRHWHSFGHDHGTDENLPLPERVHYHDSNETGTVAKCAEVRASDEKRFVEFRCAPAGEDHPHTRLRISFVAAIDAEGLGRRNTIGRFRDRDAGRFGEYAINAILTLGHAERFSTWIYFLGGWNSRSSTRYRAGVPRTSDFPSPSHRKRTGLFSSVFCPIP